MNYRPVTLPFSEREYAILNLLEPAFLVLGPEGEMMFYNQAAKKIFENTTSDGCGNDFIQKILTIGQEKIEKGNSQQRIRPAIQDHLLKLESNSKSGIKCTYSLLLRPQYGQNGITFILGMLSIASEAYDLDRRMFVIKNFLVSSAKEFANPSPTLKALVDYSLTSIYIFTEKEMLFTNRTFETLTGYTFEDFRNKSVYDMVDLLVHPDDRERLVANGKKRFLNQKTKDYFESRWIHRDGHLIWVEVRIARLQYQDNPTFLANVVNITERKLAEQKSLKYQQDLEIQSCKLEESNIALRVFLERLNEEKKKLQDDIVFNVNKLVLPFVEKLENAQLSPRNAAYVKVIKSNLEDIIHPYLNNLSLKYASLSPKQIRIVNLIKQGKQTKEIADLMCVSKAAIDFHRHSIREKLDLKKKKINLKSYLALTEKQV